MFDVVVHTYFMGRGYFKKAYNRDGLALSGVPTTYDKIYWTFRNTHRTSIKQHKIETPTSPEMTAVVKK